MGEITFVISGAEVEPTISISKYSTFSELKQKIENYIGIGVSRQTLKFNGSNLKDGNRIGDHNFDDTETLNLTVQPTQQELTISVFADGDEQQHEVKESDKVFELKKKIAKGWGFEADDMALYHLGEEMKDGHPLSEYYIHEGSQVNLRTTMLC